ncbi:hypothetical protein [Sinomonas humi]|uniref:hypothetical protein n=1 Tax=Sinomonas humi TaxID=1338436 RepID=UPI00068ACC55|nr:hypothetical protein [Sinomonas humi]
MTSETHRRIRKLSELRRGDLIEARSGVTVLRGAVYDTAPGIGVVWIRDEDTRRRRAIQEEDFSLWHVQTDVTFNGNDLVA